MKRTANTVANIQPHKRESLFSQPDKRQASSPQASTKNLPQQQTLTVVEPTKYYMAEAQLQQRLAELETMYEAQIATLSSSLYEKDRHNCELIQRVRELEAERLHLEKKLVEIVGERSICNSL